MDTAKNTIVTPIQRTSFMGNLLGRIRIVRSSEGDPLAHSIRKLAFPSCAIHDKQLSLLPRWIESGEVERRTEGMRAHPFPYQSNQHPQQKGHCTGTQHCQCNYHRSPRRSSQNGSKYI